MSVHDYLTPKGIANLNLDAAIRTHVEMVLEYTDGDVRWAAEELGVNETSIRRWKHRWAEEDKVPPSHALSPQA